MHPIVAEVFVGNPNDRFGVSNLEFDDVLVNVMSVFGVSGIILSLVVVAFAVASWYGPVKLAAKGARHVGRATVQGYKAAARIKGAQLVLASGVTILVLVSQLVALRLCLIGGNLMFLVNTNGPFWEPFLTGVRSSPFSLLSLETPWYLRWDGLVPWYVALAGLIIIMSYMIDTDSPWLSVIMGGPGVLVAVIGAFVLALIVFLLLFLGFVGFLGSGPQGIVDAFKTMETGLLQFGACLLIGSVYWGACHLVLRGSRLVIETWSANTQVA